MPIFEYKCNDCSHKFEELVAGNTVQVPCPKCGSTDTSRLLSVFAASNAGGGSAPSCASGHCGTGGFS